MQDFKTNIIESESTEKLIELFTFVKKSLFLSYRLDSKKLKE
ncbi:hypothetical protein O3794_05530 [Gemella sanguinis]